MPRKTEPTKPKPTAPPPDMDEDEVEQIDVLVSKKDIQGLGRRYPDASILTRQKIIDSLFEINTIASIVAIISILSNNHNIGVQRIMRDSLESLFLSCCIGDYFIEKLLPKGHDIKPLLLDIWENDETDEKSRELIEKIFAFCEIPDDSILKCITP